MEKYDNGSFYESQANVGGLHGALSNYVISTAKEERKNILSYNQSELL